MLIALGVFAAVWGAKLGVISRYGSDVPVMDQWDAEGGAVILPYLRGSSSWRDYFAAHSEHRILCTRVLTLALFLVNGQWDPRLENVASAAIHAALAVALVFWGGRVIEPKWHRVWLATVVVLVGLPVDWNNVISGFHSQHYFLLWFSLVALVLLPTGSPRQASWWGGAVSAGLALFSLASGLLAGVAVACACLVDGRPGSALRRHRWTLLVCALTVAAGAALTVQLPENEGLHARSFAEFAVAYWRYLAWPFERLHAISPIVPYVLAPLWWLPWGGLLLRIWSQRGGASAAERVLLAVGVWTLLQFAACAYARGTYARPASRYMDIMAIGLALNGLLLLRMMASPEAGGARRLWARLGMGTAVLAGIGIGLHLTFFFRHDLPVERELRSADAARIRRYVFEGNAARLREGEIRYPDPVRLMEALDQPELRAVLPASLQPSPGYIGAWSRMAKLATDAGPIISALGVVLIVAAERRRSRGSTSRLLSASPGVTLPMNP